VGGSYRWRLKADNGRNVASSGESFDSKSNATGAAQGFKMNAASATYEVYADTSGNYRWRAKAANGAKIASSGEAFASKQNAVDAAQNVKDNAGKADGP
jgi:uncharacterized protein YegP (UPF0339 family)